MSSFTVLWVHNIKSTGQQTDDGKQKSSRWSKKKSKAKQMSKAKKTRAIVFFFFLLLLLLHTEHSHTHKRAIFVLWAISKPWICSMLHTIRYRYTYTLYTYGNGLRCVWPQFLLTATICFSRCCAVLCLFLFFFLLLLVFVFIVEHRIELMMEHRNVYTPHKLNNSPHLCVHVFYFLLIVAFLLLLAVLLSV